MTRCARLAAFAAALLVAQPLAFCRDAGSLLTFSLARGVAGDIMRSTGEGRALTNLTNHPSLDFGPAWSRDGQWIAFTSRRDGQTHIYVMDADGQAVRRLTEGEAYHGTPTWSRDGNRVAFISDREGPPALYTARIDDGSVEKISEEPRFLSSAGPAWAPNGSLMALTVTPPVNENKGRGETLWVMDLRSKHAEVVRDNHDDPSRNSIHPAWSPDSQRIAFTTEHGAAPVWTIHTMARDGSDDREVTAGRANALDPVWSPDGKSIAYVMRNAADEFSVQVVGADGGPSREILAPGATILGLDWWGPELLDVQPGGKRPFTWGWLKRLQTASRGQQ